MRKKTMIRKITLAVIAATLGGVSIASAKLPVRQMKEDATAAVAQVLPQHLGIGKVSVKSFNISDNRKTVTVAMSGSFADVPFTAEYLETVKDAIRGSLPKKYQGYTMTITIDGRNANDYLPLMAIS